MDKLSNVREVAFLAEVKPYLDKEIEALERALDNRTYQALDRGELTPQRALEAWIEKVSYHRISRKIQQQITMGQAAGERAKSVLES